MCMGWTVWNLWECGVCCLSCPVPLALSPLGLPTEVCWDHSRSSQPLLLVPNSWPSSSTAGLRLLLHLLPPSSQTPSTGVWDQPAVTCYVAVSRGPSLPLWELEKGLKCHRPQFSRSEKLQPKPFPVSVNLGHLEGSRCGKKKKNKKHPKHGPWPRLLFGFLQAKNGPWSICAVRRCAGSALCPSDPPQNPSVAHPQIASQVAHYLFSFFLLICIHFYFCQKNTYFKNHIKKQQTLPETPHFSFYSPETASFS